MNITITTVKHEDQRYDTAGDWHDGAILVSEMGNEDYEFLVALHELVEMHLCKKHGVTQEQVDAFDLQFDEERKNRSHDPLDEPGNDGRAPYFHEHQLASIIEREMADKLGVDWNDYDDTVLKVGKPTETTMSDEQITNGQDVPQEKGEQDGEPQGAQAEPGGSDVQGEEHQEGGTPGGQGEGTPKDEVPQQG